MEDHKITVAQISAFTAYLRMEERAKGTIEKYLRDVGAFAAWVQGGEVTKETMAEWKEHLLAAQYAPVTINSMLAALNAFFRFAGWEDCRVRFLKIQRQMFRDVSKELNRKEYSLLIDAAQTMGKHRLALLMETIGGTGIRVSEVRHITVEAAQRGRTEIFLKGKSARFYYPISYAESC